MTRLGKPRLVDDCHKRMKRWLLNIAAALSLILLLLTLWLGVRTSQTDDHLIFTIGNRFFHMGSWSNFVAIQTTSPWPGHEPLVWIKKPSPNEVPVGPILFHHLVDPMPWYDSEFGVAFGRASERTYVGPDRQSRWDRSGNNNYVPNDDVESRETELMQSHWVLIPRTHLLVLFAICLVAWLIVRVRKRFVPRTKLPVCDACGSALEAGSERCPKCGKAIARE